MQSADESLSFPQRNKNKNKHTWRPPLMFYIKRAACDGFYCISLCVRWRYILMRNCAHAMLQCSLCTSVWLALPRSLLNVIRLGLRYNSVNAKQITKPRLRTCSFLQWKIQVATLQKMAWNSKTNSFKKLLRHCEWWCARKKKCEICFPVAVGNISTTFSQVFVCSCKQKRKCCRLAGFCSSS